MNLNLLFSPPRAGARKVDRTSSRATTLRVAAFGGFAPFSWSENGVPHGRDLAFLRSFARHEGLDFQVEFFDFDRLWEQPARGHADIAASGISRLPRGRAANVAWTRPYASVRRALLIRESDRARFRSMADFYEARLAAVPGSAATAHALSVKPATATLLPCKTLELGIDDLLARRVDAVGTGDISARHHLAIRRGLAMIDVHGGAPPESVVFAVRKNQSLLRRLNAFIGRAAAAY